MASQPEEVVKIQVESLTVRYGKHTALNKASFSVEPHAIFGVIGPAGSGKTTMLRCLNRTLENIRGASMEGMVKIDGQDTSSIRPVSEVRRRVGMVAPLPVGLPMSIYDNVAFAPRMAGTHDKATLDQKVQTCLTQAALWDEVKDRLDQLGTKLSGGQQQRLTIARALSHDPEILCLDEFSIAVDPVTTMRIEDVLKELQSRMTIVLVTNLVQQARRLAKRTMFLLNSELVEEGPTDQLFDSPTDSRTRDYVQGVFG
jgi:phosphate transport system ATP-binding protein